MYQGKYVQRPRHSRRRRRRSVKPFVLLTALLLLLVTVGGVIAFLTTNTGPIANTFTPSSVGVDVEEEFDGETKSDVNVQNTGDIAAYIRVRLVTYRVNDADQPIGGTAQIPAFTPGDGWVQHGGFYYYTSPVAPGQTPSSPLIGTEGIKLQAYTDADGGKQVIEVLAEGIQADGQSSDGRTPSQIAWGVTITEGSVTPYQQ